MSEDYTEVMGHNPAIQMPHCDQLILHSPGTCEYCDRHVDWQAYRAAAGIAFSDMSAADVASNGLAPCPSTYRRSAEARDRWGGNVPALGWTSCPEGKPNCGILGPHIHPTG